MKEEFEHTADLVQFTFVGRVSDQVKEYVKEDAWLSKIVNFPGYVIHSEVFGFYEKADALILILTDTKNAKGNIPGKVFEYLATGLPVLALGDPKGDSAVIIKEGGAGQVLPHTAHASIQIALRKLADSVDSDFSVSTIDRFSRKNLTHQLTLILNADSVS
jgi:glycosyltransferase involved in cell wall biosynthesis